MEQGDPLDDALTRLGRRLPDHLCGLIFERAVLYRIDATEMIRVEKRDRVEDGRRERTERFRLPSVERAWFEFQAGEVPEAALVIQWRSAPPESGRSRQFRVIATVGRDHRFSSQEK
jgi:hypothetical protein